MASCHRCISSVQFRSGIAVLFSFNKKIIMGNLKSKITNLRSPFRSKGRKEASVPSGIKSSRKTTRPTLLKTKMEYPVPIVQDIDSNEKELKYGRYKNCLRTQSGNAVGFELVFDRPRTAARPQTAAADRNPRPKTRKRKKQLMKKMKAAEKRKNV